MVTAIAHNIGQLLRGREPVAIHLHLFRVAIASPVGIASDNSVIRPLLCLSVRKWRAFEGGAVHDALAPCFALLLQAANLCARLWTIMVFSGTFSILAASLSFSRTCLLGRARKKKVSTDQGGGLRFFGVSEGREHGFEPLFVAP